MQECERQVPGHIDIESGQIKVLVQTGKTPSKSPMKRSGADTWSNKKEQKFGKPNVVASTRYMPTTRESPNSDKKKTGQQRETSRSILTPKSAKKPEMYQEEIERLRNSNDELKSALTTQRQEKELLAEEVQKMKNQLGSAEKSRELVSGSMKKVGCRIFVAAGKRFEQD